MKTFKLIVIILAILMLIAIGFAAAHQSGYREGYCQGVTDHESDRPLKFRLEKRENGETVWVQVKPEL